MTSGATPPLPPPPATPFVPFAAAWAVDPPDQPGAVVGLGIASIGTTLIGAFIPSVYVQVRARVEAESSAESLAHALTSGDPFR